MSNLISLRTRVPAGDMRKRYWIVTSFVKLTSRRRTQAVAGQGSPAKILNLVCLDGPREEALRRACNQSEPQGSRVNVLRKCIARLPIHLSRLLHIVAGWTTEVSSWNQLHVFQRSRGV